MGVDTWLEMVLWIPSYLYKLVILPFVSPHSRVYGIYLAVFVVIGVIVVAGQEKHLEKNWRKVFGVAFSSKIYLHRSAKQDYLFYFFYQAFFLLLPIYISILTVDTVMWSVSWRLTALYPIDPAPIGVQAKMFLTLMLFVAYDFASYVGHRLQHAVPWLWEFHKVHHSAEVLTPITTYRENPVDSILISLLGTLFAGVVGGVFEYLYGEAVRPYTIMGVLALTWFFYLLVNFRHSNIWISYGYRLNHFFSSPALHMIHHSSESRHWDRNYGLALSVWDVIFRTEYIPRGREHFRLGLSDRSEADYASLGAKFFLPFRRCTQRLWLKVRKGSLVG